MTALGQIVLSPTPTPTGSSPSDILRAVSNWTRQAEQAVRKIEAFLNGANQVTTGSTSPEGVSVGRVGDIYNQIAAGALVKQWVKVTGNYTTKGWA